MPRVKSWLVCGALFGALLAGPSCSDTTNVTAIPRAKGCEVEADCDKGLTCTKRENALGGLCHQDCTSSENCAAGERCVHSETESNVCQFASEGDCIFDSDCFEPLKCGPDQQCRDACKNAYDCISPQVCVTEPHAGPDAPHYCAEPYEVNKDGLIVHAAENPGAGGQGGGTTMPGTGRSGGGGSVGDVATGGGTRGGMGGTTNTSAAGDAMADAGAGAAAGEGGGPAIEPVPLPCGMDFDCQAFGQLCGSESPELCGGCQEDAECTSSSAYGAGTLCIDGACRAGTCHPDGDDCPIGQSCDGNANACRLHFSRMAVSQIQTCGIAGSGTVWCWGTRGPLGDGTETASARPVLVKAAAGSGPFLGATEIAVAGGSNEPRVCVVKTGGTVWCWGGSNVGDGTSAKRLIPVQVNDVDGAHKLSGALSVAARGGSFNNGGGFAPDAMCALLADGYPRCWGDGYLGDGSASGSVNPIVLNLPNTTALDGSLARFCFLSSNTPWCLSLTFTPGSSVLAYPMSAVALSDAVEVAAGTMHSCARKSDNSVWCWGSGTNGSIQLGDGSTAVGETPVRVRNPKGDGWLEAISIGAGFNVSCAVLPSRYVACWGANDRGQLGIGAAADQPLPVQIPLFDSVQKVLPGVGYTCALKTDGSAWCWGNDTPSGRTSGTPLPVFP